MAKPEDDTFIHADLKTPKAAALAGIIFSLLMFTIFGLLRRSIPAGPLEPGAWLATDTRTIALALNLVPFAGVAFLWFLGVLRDRLDRREDRFFATVFFGSAMLFLAMLFAAAAVIGAVLLLASTAEPTELMSSATFRFARAAAYIMTNVYATKMSAVFMISTSTVVIQTGIAPRWIALIGYFLALVLLIGSYHFGWSFAVLPVWVFLISVHILTDNLRRPQKPDA
jgi:MFS family permease